LCGLLLGLLLLADPAAAREAPAQPSKVAALQRQYALLASHRDFSSFSKRMETIRALGRLESAEAEAALLAIIQKSKLIDDEIVAIIALGPGLDAPGAQALALLVARRKGAVRIEALGESFSEVSDPSALAWLAGDALRAKDRGVLLAALRAQAVHADPAALDRARALFMEQGERRDGIDLAYAALQALGSIGGPAVRSTLLRAVGHRDYRIRLAAADVMARQQPTDVNVRGALRKLLVDDAPVVRQAAAASIGEAKLEELLPELSERLLDAHVKTRDVAYRALKQITGEDLGFDPEDWMRWWKYRSEDAKAHRLAPSSTSASYYGVQVRSDRLLFIVDLSGSMAFPWGHDETRIAVARSQLRLALSHLAPSSLFNMIVFSDKVKAWRKGEVQAQPDTVKRALAWVGKTFNEPHGGTFMHAALEIAFRDNPQTDTIFLLTDGLATDGTPIVPEAILSSVRIWNRYRRVVVNTFALTLEDMDPGGLERRELVEIKHFMRQLARLTGGTCQIIRKPPPQR